MPMFGLISSLLKPKPTIPSFQPIDIGAELSKLMRSNLENLPQTVDFAGKATDANSSLVLRALRGVNPDYDKLASGISQNALSFMRGEIPEDVSKQVIRRSAEGAVGGGYGGSGVSRNLVARDLGLTSLNLINQGTSSAQTWLAQTNALSKPVTASSMMASPETALGIAVQDRDAKFQRDYASNINNANFSNAGRLASAAAGTESFVSSL